MAPLSYFDVRLFVAGYRVKQLFVVSLGAERFWRLAFHDRRGMDDLKWSDVKTVQVRDVCRIDGVGKGKRVKKLKVVEVKLTRADSELALRVAHGVVNLIEDAGYRILDAIVPQRDKSGQCVGEHDLICEKRRQAVASRTKASFEIKLRIVYSPKTLPKAREQMQTLTWKLWPAAKADAKHNFAERVCVLLRWNACDPFNVFDKWETTYAESISADATTKKPENWRPLWGWGKRLPSAAEIKAAASAKKIQKAMEKARAQAQADEQKAFDRIYIQCRNCRKHNKEMRSVLDLLHKVKKTKKVKAVLPNINQRLPVWARKWGWPAHSFAQDVSLASRTGGGRTGYGATYDALRDIYKFVSTP